MARCDEKFSWSNSNRTIQHQREQARCAVNDDLPPEEHECDCECPDCGGPAVPEDEPDYSDVRCNYCQGSVEPLGRLGSLLWFRCRACGAELSIRG